jgi:hypothetical protein
MPAEKPRHQYLVVELQLPEQFRELLFQRFLAHIAATASGRVALALIGVASTMIIDLAFLLDLADHGAAAGMPGDQPGKSEGIIEDERLLACRTER